MKRHYIILIFISVLLTVTLAIAQDDAEFPEPAQEPPVNAPLQVPPQVPADAPPSAVPNVQPAAPRQAPKPGRQPGAAPLQVPPQVPADAPPSAVPNVQPVAPRQAPQPGLPPGAAANATADQVRNLLTKPKEENFIILNFDNADLRDVINTVGAITKENFIISPGVDARITIHSAKKIPVSEVMNVFESVLEVNGISLVRSGEFLKVVPGASAKQKPLEIKKGGKAEDVAAVDRIMTQIVPVKFIPVTEINTVLTPLLSQFGSIIPNPRNNLLIISDLSSNIKRLLVILEEIDVNAFQNTRMLFFKPQFSDITTLTDELTEVLNVLNITKEGLSLLPIVRINSIVVFSSSASLLEAVEGWLKKLDSEIISGQNVFIYHVQNVKAESIADVLETIYGEGGASKKVAVRRDQPKAPAQAQAAGQPAAQAQAARQQTTKESAGGGGGKVEIITFEPSNSLIILASPGLYREMTETIKRIDTYPRSVLIEGILAQVTLSDTDNYGIQWSTLQGIKIRGSDFDSIIQSTSDKAPALLSAAPVLASGSAGLTFALFKPDKLSALVAALSSRGKVNILSSPRLLVRDQEEASIEVGSEIPTATSSTASTTTETLTQSIQYKTVGIKLKIKPTINEEKTVVLDLEQEVSAQGSDVTVGTQGTTFPSFTVTKTKTSIVVPDKQGIVIGGILDETKDKGYVGIPLLSDIPILGNLFRYSTNITTKKELIIIIVPHVVVNDTEGEVLTNEFVGKLKEVKKYLEEKDIEYVKPPEGTQPSRNP